MFERLKNWLTKEPSAKKPSRSAQLYKSGVHPAPGVKKRPVQNAASAPLEFTPNTGQRIEDAGPGKNVLIRNRFVREDTGTHETLKILDDSLIDTGEETGIDPYNTGGFDRSKNWNNRFRD